MSEATSSSSYIIPHDCVTKNTSTSPKLRVVFNALDPGYNKTSLKSLLLAGSKLQSDISDVIKYELNTTVTYGVVPSAFLAQRCLKQLVIDEGDPFLMVSQAFLHNTKVDDIVTGASSSEEARTLLAQL
ncbi:uncharacterized protein LOC123302287 [Chrysoperla carnea]|uniref:uncharacterized protein LOC123302287 n=1 Tax=Chrysoperla carnea TaxID=189513 RepID=UPI001D05DE13|nr:uncharacterized protein LOC123302287 [Chrysoperla carnea]